MTSSQHEIFAGARPEYHVWGDLSPRHGRMASAGARAYNGGPGTEPLVGGQGAKPPPEAENLLASGCATEAANLPHFVRTLTLST